MTAILVVSPGGSAGKGGICRLVADTARAWDAASREANAGPGRRMRVIDSGGMARGPRMGWMFAHALARVLAACATGRAALLHVHVASRGSVVRKACFVLAGRLLGVPVVLHMHGADFAESYAALGAVSRALTRRVFRSADMVLTLGPAQAAHARTLGLAPRRISVLANAVPGARSRREAGVPARSDAGGGRDRHGSPPCRLLFLGAMGHRKGLDVLLTALAMPALATLDWRLTVAGPGPLTLWREETARLGLGHRVAFTGFLPSDAARDELGRHDVLVLPSRQEAMPIAILEAMAAGLPVIASDVGDVRELVVPGTTGLLVPPADPTALASCLARLILSPAERAWLGRQGRARQRSFHDIDIYTRRLGALYDTMLGTQSGAPPADAQRALAS